MPSCSSCFSVEPLWRTKPQHFHHQGTLYIHIITIITVLSQTEAMNREIGLFFSKTGCKYLNVNKQVRSGLILTRLGKARLMGSALFPWATMCISRVDPRQGLFTFSGDSSSRSMDPLWLMGSVILQSMTAFLCDNNDLETLHFL